MEPSEWTSLPSDLIRRVADFFLASRDVDYYMSLRAVCRNWRTATDDPSGLDPRFSPRGWVLVGSLAGDDQTGRRCLFLHVNTGRFLWKGPLCNYTCVASTEDGHLVLEPASRNSRICLLNPMTGRLVSLPVTTAQFLGDNEFGLSHGRNMFATGSSSMVLYSLFDSSSGGCIDLTWDQWLCPGFEKSLGPPLAVVEHNCRLDEKPEVTRVVTSGWNWINDRSTFLVDNAGELLLVSLLASEREMQVFRVDLENGLLEQIKGIGSRAIFLGKRRCLSVDAYNFQAIESNCIYYIGSRFDFDCGIFMHRLKDGSHVKLFESRCVPEGPKSLARVLMEYACYGHYA
ncbi:hypothetical protein ACQ4PT_042576 [Festuca glaucescens]